MKTLILPLMLTIGIAFAVSGSVEETTGTDAPPRNETKMQADFVFDFYRTVAKNKRDENLAVSPYGAEQLLDFVRTGAAGKMRTEIDHVVGPATPDKWNKTSEGPLTTAAALWIQQEHPILPEFLKAAREEFGASAEHADFTGNADETVKRINAWYSEKTNGKIPALFDRLGETTRCVLAGAVHFAADWNIPFDKDATTLGAFSLEDGTKVKTNMMSRTGSMKYVENDAVCVLELPYKNDGYAMLLLLPKTSDMFVDVETGLTSEKLTAWRSAMKTEQIDLRMPRFTTESDLVLNEPLKRLGMPTAFSRDADFSKIDGLTDLYLSEVRQKTFVRVDETGTEAAAATGAVIAVKSAMLEVKPFYADRPFLYAIIKENTVLFLGRFVKPDTEKPFVDPGLSGEGGSFQ